MTDDFLNTAPFFSLFLRNRCQGIAGAPTMAFLKHLPVFSSRRRTRDFFLQREGQWQPFLIRVTSAKPDISGIYFMLILYSLIRLIISYDSGRFIFFDMIQPHSHNIS